MCDGLDVLVAAAVGTMKAWGVVGVVTVVVVVVEGGLVGKRTGGIVVDVDVVVVVEVEVEGMRVESILVDVVVVVVVDVLVLGVRLWGRCGDTVEGICILWGETAVVGAKGHPLTQDCRSPVCGMYCRRSTTPQPCRRVAPANRSHSSRRRTAPLRLLLMARKQATTPTLAASVMPPLSKPTPGGVERLINSI